LREDRRGQIALSEDPEARLIDLAIHEEVSLAAYDAAWVARFVAERARLHAEFPQLLEIEHFGSTAVPGMPAKPIIDILAGVESMAIADALFEPILAFGYTTSRAFNAMLADRRWFMRCANGRRTHHLHVVVFEGQAWTARIRFRDMLRYSTLLALQYAELKSALAVRYRHDREAYSEAKSAFVAAVVARA